MRALMHSVLINKQKNTTELPGIEPAGVGCPMGYFDCQRVY